MLRRYRKVTTDKISIAIAGAGRLATFLAVALNGAGFRITEIIGRDSPASRRRVRSGARSLAAKVGARAVDAGSAVLDCDLLWVCVPDREIGNVASVLADRLLERRSESRDAASLRAGAQRVSRKVKVRFALHSSGALSSRKLDQLGKAGVAVASAHPLMTFVAGGRPSLGGVSFALEGDRDAMQIARRIVRKLGGESFSLPVSQKAAYHAWATMTSPLFVAFLVTLEEAARAAGVTREEARRRSLPILRQTLANYSRMGAARSFSGPLIRGDAETVAKHLAVLKKYAGVREMYTVLARVALRGLPVKNRGELKKLLKARRKL